MMEISKYLLFEIYGYSLTDFNIEIGLKGLKNVCEIFLTPREQKVLELRYVENKTLEEAAKELDVTRERIRQIESKTIHKLNLPKYRERVFSNDYDYEIIKLREEKELLISDIRKEIAILKPFLEWVNAFPQDLIQAKEKINYQAVLLRPISDLDLSVRSYNCLKRAGIDTIEDLLQKDGYDLQKIRNMGRKSLKEIYNKVHEKGFDFYSHWSLDNDANIFEEEDY